MAPRKVIISCAVTGSIHTPSMSPHLPVTAEEIAESALGAAEAGAAIVHLHARNPADGRPDQSPEAFEPFLRSDQAIVECRRQSHDRRRALYDGRGARPAGGKMEAGDRLAQHGLDELRPVSHAEALQGVQARVGAEDAGGLARSRVSQQLQGHSLRARNAERDRRALRVRVLRHEPSLQSPLFPHRRAS